jgi:hypothetical protein
LKNNSARGNEMIVLGSIKWSEFLLANQRVKHSLRLWNVDLEILSESGIFSSISDHSSSSDRCRAKCVDKGFPETAAAF